MKLSFRDALALAATLVAGCTIESGPMLHPRDAGVDAPMDARIDAPPIDGGFSCSPGVPGCWGQTHYVCGEDDTRLDEELCEDACDPALGCVVCVPNTRRCDGDVSMICDSDGTRWLFGRDCGDWGSSCGPLGTCEDACADAELLRSYVGCEYWPVPLPNYRDPGWEDVFDFRVVVANPARETAEVTVFRGARLVTRQSIAPGGVAEIALPWIDEVSFPFDGSGWAGHTIADGAYRLISSRPVIVTQFNPFHYAYRGAFSFTNDASLLLPTHALGDEHVALSYPPLSGGNGVNSTAWPGYLALVGVSPEPTRVEITPVVDVAADAAGRWPATPAGETLTFMLARGEVAIVTPAEVPPCTPERPGFRPYDPAAPEGGGTCLEPEHDLTGSRVVSDRALAALGGHTCAYVPFDTPACDHLETTLAPVDTWGSEFQTMPLRDPTTDVPNVLRIVAAHDGTTLTLDPPQRGIPAGTTLDAGELVETLVDGPVSITASRPVQVGQLLMGQNLTDPPLERGDPGLTILVPVEQFRREYVFVTPSSYSPVTNGQSWVLVSREPGEVVLLDGHPIEASWSRVGARELAIVPLNGGAHRASSDAPFGLVAYGLGTYTSYAYPAGLDLRVIPI